MSDTANTSLIHRNFSDDSYRHVGAKGKASQTIKHADFEIIHLSKISLFKKKAHRTCVGRRKKNHLTVECLKNVNFQVKNLNDIPGGKDWQDAQTEAIKLILYFRDLSSNLKKNLLKSQIVLRPGRHLSKLLSIYVKF